MSGNGTTRADIAAAVVASMKRFAMLPEVTLRIIEVVRDQRRTIRELARIVSTDPALCMRILRVVNSAFYGLPRSIASIERAIMMLGAEGVMSIAIAASFGRLIRSGAFARELWQHSLAVACATKSLAEVARLANSSEMFLCGLVHDIGFLVELRHDPAAFAAVAHERARSGRSLGAIEEETLGANHADFGRELCDQWQLPPWIGEVVGALDAPLELEGPSRIAACTVNVADALAAAAGFAFLPVPDERAAPDPAVVAELGIAGRDVDAIAAAIPELTAELCAALAA
ncbi:MAG: HDOD domain-containing protein [Gammaproteobacteria bacterium]|nr:hypothetical protein [Gammaproteobacteria bacterium]